MNDLTPEKAWIFRITHIGNVPWILDHGLHCCNSNCRDPNFREIGNPDLIGRRTRRAVPIAPGGMLSDYVPFYFTPHSPMLLNIKTGWNGLQKTPMPDIAILVTSLDRVAKEGIRFVFTDRHAYVMGAQFFGELCDLVHIDWPLLQARDFKRNPDDPGKCERYQAEALIHGVVPVSALSGIAYHGAAQEKVLQEEVTRRSLTTTVAVKPGWYF
jgi:ssDNA thymidine ADP-ribosyltransferase, DarT